MQLTSKLEFRHLAQFFRTMNNDGDMKLLVLRPALLAACKNAEVETKPIQTNEPQLFYAVCCMLAFSTI